MHKLKKSCIKIICRWCLKTAGVLKFHTQQFASSVKSTTFTVTPCCPYKMPTSNTTYTITSLCRMDITQLNMNTRTKNTNTKQPQLLD